MGSDVRSTVATIQPTHAELKASSFPVLINKVRNYTDDVLSCEWRGPGIKGNADPTTRPVDNVLLDLLLALVLTYHPLPNGIARSEERRVGKECRFMVWRVKSKE